MNAMLLFRQWQIGGPSSWISREIAHSVANLIQRRVSRAPYAAEHTIRLAYLSCHELPRTPENNYRAQTELSGDLVRTARADYARTCRSHCCRPALPMSYGRPSAEHTSSALRNRQRTASFEDRLLTMAQDMAMVGPQKSERW